jgi:uncharacterized protein
MQVDSKNFSALSLLGLPVSKRLTHCPKFLSAIVSEAVLRLDVEKIALFGSRANGTQRTNSDYDICFWLSANQGANSAQWDCFLLWISDESPTLHSIDAVNFEQLHEQLKLSILKEQVTIYEKTNQRKTA